MIGPVIWSTNEAMGFHHMTLIVTHYQRGDRHHNSLTRGCEQRGAAYSTIPLNTVPVVISVVFYSVRCGAVRGVHVQSEL